MNRTKFLLNISLTLTDAICIYIFNMFSNIIIGIVFSTILSTIFLYFYAKISLLDLVLYYAINYFICINTYIFSSNLNFYLTFAILLIISIICNNIFYTIANKYKNNSIISSINNKPKLIITLSTLDLIILLSSIIMLNINVLSKIKFICIYDLIFSSIAIIAFHICKSNLLKLKIENLELSLKSTSTLYDTTRAFKHDFQNIIQAIGGYIWVNDFEGLKKYYKQVFNDCNSSNNLSKLSPELINNPAVYNIIANKYFIAENNGITLNIDVMLDFKQLNMKTYEFTRILGILLDNAIEATKECSQKSINLCFRKDKNKQIFLIENTYTNKEISIDKIFDKNFTTKPNNTGLGLWEVKKILSRNKNVLLFTNKNDTFFTQQLEMYC